MRNRKSLNVAVLCLIALLIAISGGCAKKVAEAPWPTPPPPPPSRPTATLSADPNIIQREKSSYLTWNTTDATDVWINRGIGAVSFSGKLSVSPSSSTTYRLTAKGEGGTATHAVRVTVTAPKAPPGEPGQGNPAQGPVSRDRKP